MDRWLVAQTADLATGKVSITNGQTIHAVRGNALSIEWSVEVLNNGEPADISGCTCLACNSPRWNNLRGQRLD